MKSTMSDVPLTVAGIVRHAAVVHPDRRVISAIAPDQTTSVTYSDIVTNAARLANALQAIGVKGDQRVGTFQWNNAAHLEAYAAVPSMGAVLHTLNLRLTAEQLAYIANHAEDRVLIVDGSAANLVAPALREMRTVHTVLLTGGADPAVFDGSGKEVISYDDALAAHDPEFAWPEVDERSAAAICYTSGTTGNPKGVIYSHRSTWLHSQAACTRNALGVAYDDLILVIVPMFHANAWGLPYAAMMAGAELLLPDRYLQAEPLVTMIESHRPTMSGAVPTIWTDILALIRKQPERDLSSLGFVACGGSAVARSLMEAFDKLGVTIVQAWGMTESSPLATVALAPCGLPEDQTIALRAKQGRAIAGVELRVTAEEGGQALPPGPDYVGEIELRGPWITASYAGGEDSEKFREGWLRTGDIGYIDEHHFLRLTDRSKDVIKSGGEWISSVDLENALVGHPDVQSAAVIAIPDDKWQERPLAVIVCSENAAVDSDDLRNFLADRVAKWWIPDHWVFADELPLTGTGKIDKKALRALRADGRLDASAKS